MPDIITFGNYVVVLSTPQFEWIKSFDGGVEELKKAAKKYDLYIQDWGKPEHRVIVNEEGELKLL